MEWALIISIIALLSGALLGWTGKARTLKKDAAQEATSSTELKKDIEYIKEGIDGIRDDIKDQREKVDDLVQRVTKLEEFRKQIETKKI